MIINYPDNTRHIKNLLDYLEQQTKGADVYISKIDELDGKHYIHGVVMWDYGNEDYFICGYHGIRKYIVCSCIEIL